MQRLLKYLVADTWLQTPGIYIVSKGDWIYSWMADQGLGIPSGTAYLFRRPSQRETPVSFDLELFIIRGEDRCLEIAKELSDGKHPSSPEPDPETGKKIGYL